MKKFGQATIERIVKRAIKEFKEDLDAPDFLYFFWKGHYVEAVFAWSPSCRAFYLLSFSVVYSRCVMTYTVDVDFDCSIAWCE